MSARLRRRVGSVDEKYRKYSCQVCGYIYDERLGDPEHGVAPGTRWADVPSEWACPDCGLAKSAFERCDG